MVKLNQRHGKAAKVPKANPAPAPNDPSAAFANSPVVDVDDADDDCACDPSDSDCDHES